MEFKSFVTTRQAGRGCPNGRVFDVSVSVHNNGCVECAAVETDGNRHHVRYHFYPVNAAIADFARIMRERGKVDSYKA